MKTLYLILISLLLAVCSQARTITVDGNGPADFDTIQAAIDDSNDGDTVIVTEGTYKENINFKGKNIILTSIDPTSEDIVSSTIIDGNNVNSVVTFFGTEGSNCVLSGFTITNGRGHLYGGGIHGNSTTATIQNNIICGNKAMSGGMPGAYGYGGGLFNCDGIIQDNTICDNSAMMGGGLACCNSIIQRNTIVDNRAGYLGGGLHVCHGIIRNNIITGNKATGHGGGLAYCNAVVSSNIISYNSCYGSGGGLHQCNAEIKHNGIWGNRANSGGGLAKCQGLVNGCTIAGNLAYHDGGGLNDWSGPIVNCVIWNNVADNGSQLWSSTSPTYSCIQDWPGGGQGNIKNDPCFVEPGYWGDVNDPNIIVEPSDPHAVWIDGDYHLWVDSPCIDTGDPNYTAGPNETDLDGKPRVMGGRIDMGAYEYSLPIEAQVNFRPRVINLANNGRFVFCQIRLPEGYDVNEIEPDSILLEEQIEPVSVRINQQGQLAMLRFNRTELQGILDTGWVELLVSGELTDGTIFEGTDTIRVIDRARK